MGRSTLWLIAIVVVTLAAIAFGRAMDDEPGISAPSTTHEATSTQATSPTTTVAPAEPATPTIPPAVLPPATVACEIYGPIEENGSVTSADLVEASGLTVSRVSTDVLWSHNDSRDAAVLYAMTTAGESLGVYGLPGAFAFDWEDIASGPDATGSGEYLYVADIGDNFNIRAGRIVVYRVPDADPASMDESFSEVVALPFRYPDGVHNAEAIFIDPVDPAIYVVTKDTERTLVFRGSLTPGDGPSDLELVTAISLGAEVSGGDISWDGGVIAFRGYSSVWMWNRDEGESIAEALGSSPCQAPAPNERQGESLAFSSDLSYWTVSEGKNPEIHVVDSNL
ncbi:MAG: hypothetical protein ACC654_05500 [Acidimicrobiia bacterium]